MGCTPSRAQGHHEQPCCCACCACCINPPRQAVLYDDPLPSLSDRGQVLLHLNTHPIGKIGSLADLPCLGSTGWGQNMFTAGHGGAPSSEEESLTSGEGDAAESHRALAHGHNYGSRLHQPQPAQPPSWQEQHQQPAPIPAPGLGACGAWMPGVGGAGQAGAGLLQAIRVHLRARGFGRGPEGAEEEGMGGEAGAPEAAPLGQGILVSALNTLSRSLSPEHMPHARSGQMPHVLHAVSPDDSLLFSVGTGSPATRKQWSASLPHIRTDHLHHARSEHGPHTHTSHEDSDDGNMTDAGSQFSDNEELLAEALVEAEEGQGAVPAGLGGQPGWESNVHGAQAYQAQHDLVTGVAACHALDAHKAGTLGFSFSGGGFWFPYSLGSAMMARDLGILRPTTPLAGASCGAIIVACINVGMSNQEIVNALMEFATDCRTHGTAGRLRHVIEKFLTAYFPHDAHERCRNRTHIQLTKVLPLLKVVTISEWESKEDLIECVATSCHIPAYMTGGRDLLARYRGKLWVDGGLLSHIPTMPADAGASWVTGISCVPVQFLQSLPGAARLQLLRAVEISPDTFHPFPFSWPQVGGLTLAPAEDAVLLQMIEMGKRDMVAWARAVGIWDHLLMTRAGPTKEVQTEGVMMASREPGRLNMGWQRVSIQEEWHDPGSGAADAHVLQSSAHPRILRVTGGSLVAPEMDLSQSKQCTATINVAPGAGKKRTVQVTALVAGQEVQLVLNLE